jgi:hypothetical protein
VSIKQKPRSGRIPDWGKVPYEKRTRSPGGAFGYTLPSQSFDMENAYAGWRLMMDELYR